ncbi:amylo-alpha-1,6-glucosidase [Nanoarchaeota archaeon]
MRIIHSVADAKKEGEGEGSFLLADSAGGYLCLPNKKLNNSNYEGWVCFNNDNWSMYKTIENIYLDKDVNTIHNKFSHVERDSGATTERFFLCQDALIYEVFNYDGFVNIDLDFRDMYDYSTEGRMFEMYTREGGVLIIKYIKYKENSMEEVDHEKYIAVKNVRDYWITGQWLQRNYPYDEQRNSRHEFFVYGTLKIKVSNDSKLVFAQANNEEQAFKKVQVAWHDMNLLQNRQEKLAHENINTKDMALNAAINSLNGLAVDLDVEGRDVGVFAGYPWYHQFWARDELISLKALMITEDYFLVKGVLIDYMNFLKDDGWLDNKNIDSDLESADAAGWLFLRLHEFLEILNKQKKLYDYFTKSELEGLMQGLDKAIQNILKKHSKDGLIMNKKLETWMDTSNDSDVRSGARIEIQALQLRMYKCAQYLASLLGKEANEYEELEAKMLKKVAKFWKNGKLADGIDGEADFTQRPNLFLAYYIYPEMLAPAKWKKAFDSALKELWLPWGGLASISKKSPLYREDYTGETNESYHRGDSWFFVNNIAAICMKSLDEKKYKKHIDKIIQANADEILFSGFLGHCAELSSAKELQSLGCQCQAWSAATFIELMH